MKLLHLQLGNQVKFINHY